MSFKSSLVVCLLIINITFSFSQDVDKNPPWANYITALLTNYDGQNLMIMKGQFFYRTEFQSKPNIMKMSFLATDPDEQSDPIFFDALGYVYIKSDEGYIKTYFDTVLFPLIPFLSQADEFKSDVDVELGIDPLPDSWPLLSLVTKYNIGHFEGKDHLVKKSQFRREDGSLVWTKYSAIDPDNLGNSIVFDKYGRLKMIITPQGTIQYNYFYSEDSADQISDFPMYAKHEPNMGEMMVGLLISLFGGLGG
ncbi:MAG: hypothetical protein KJO39_11685 [Bacteroidia bacterium]|nr:hypothetical protein [Bacteroidia bacterium]NNF31743.1 hypothetical protein [Flavobacteriaceae bacterium]NNJ81096.1 hypothetical protein [Flavobacteriaceae bacterium]NNK55257.1 hypothetical protein [Flavobacteriaceae bacterium]NNM10252.1 hypothetical protein [Flavobacteriaceae bacterium]